MPVTAEQWTAEAEKIRERVLGVVYHGWLRERVDSPPKFRDMGEIPSGKGYRIGKMQYEIVPGFYSPALLYEPEHLTGKAPTVLDVMGHFSVGKAEEFEQKLCINHALRGMIALNPEWPNMGELKREENNLFSEIATPDGIASFAYLYSTPVKFEEAPKLSASITTTISLSTVWRFWPRPPGSGRATFRKPSPRKARKIPKPRARNERSRSRSAITPACTKTRRSRLRFDHVKEGCVKPIRQTTKGASSGRLHHPS